MIKDKKKNILIALLSVLLLFSVGLNALFVSPYVINKFKQDDSEFFDARTSDKKLISAVVNASMSIEDTQMSMNDFHGLRQDVEAMFESERNSDIFNNYYMAYNLVGLSQYALKTKKADVLEYLQTKADSWIGKNGRLVYEVNRVDQCPIGIMYLNLFKITGEKKYNTVVNQIYDYLKNCRIEGNLISYNNNINNFSDAVGMYVPFLMEYYIATKDTLARRIAIDNIEHFKINGVDDDTHLPFHGYNIKTGIKLGSCNWGRGIGWYLLAIAYCPETNDSILQKNVNKLSYTQFPLSSNKFDSSTAIMFEIYKQSVNHDRKLNLDFIRTHVRQDGFVSDCSGDTYDLNDYSHSFGNNELCNGLLLLLYSKQFNS